MIPDQGLKFENVRHGSLMRNNVWKARAEDGKIYAVKQYVVPAASDYSPSSVEVNTLKLLRREGCPVPEVIDREEEFVLLEWCGDLTLDDVCQYGDDDEKKLYAKLAIEGFCKIEETFSRNSKAIEPYVFHVAKRLGLSSKAYRNQNEAVVHNQKSLPANSKKLLASARGCISNLAWLRGEQLSETESKLVDDAWNEIARCILNETLSLGSLDYNALNIIVDKNKVSFIDFSSIGYDWRERRLVQYLTGLGAHKENGNFVGLLDKESVNFYVETLSGEGFENGTTLADYHQILFYLIAIVKLLDALKAPEKRESVLLKRSWGDVESRLKRTIFLLANESLSDDESALFIRGLIGQFWDGED